MVAEKSEFFFRALKHSVHQSVRWLGLVVVLPNVVLVPVSGLLTDINKKDASFIIDVSTVGSQVDALVLLGVVQQDGLVSSVYNVLDQNNTIFEKQVHMILGLLALLLLFENEQVDCLAQVAKCDFDNFFRLFGKFVGNQISFRVDKLIDEDLHVFQDKRTQDSIVRNSDCL
jgi:hypothetical protein